MSSRVRSRALRSLVISAVVIGGGTLTGRLLGYNLGFNTVVRCRQGHLFTTVWILGVSSRRWTWSWPGSSAARSATTGALSLRYATQT